MKNNNTWFKSWFDSEYYHLLYKNRNEEEAKEFITNLIDYLNPTFPARALDLACGKGRHSRFLANCGFNTIGVDLSVNSIKSAKAFEGPELTFYQHDMRTPVRINYFDYVFNLFTSFGYFETEREHQKTLNSIQKSLRPNSTVVIDFLNTAKVLDNLVTKETKTEGGIKFEITRAFINGYITKNIEFSDQNQQFSFQERVRGYKLADFKTLLNNAKIEIVDTFGDYQLSKFKEMTSPRLIIIGRKND